jgi:hypothetical protein
MEIKEENVRKVISGSPDRETDPIRAECLSCMAVGHISHSATIKGGQAGAREPTFVVPTVPPQTLTTKTDQRGAEARGLTHLASDTRPPSYDSDRHRRYVFILFGSRYTFIIFRL